MILHDPNSEDFYGVHWAPELDDGETLATSDWEFPTASLDGVEDGLIEEVAGKADSINGAYTIVWLTGGTPGEQYELVNHVVTSADRELDQTMKVTVLQR